MTVGSGWPSTAVNMGSTSTACGCQRSLSETAGQSPWAIRGAGCDWCSRSASPRLHRRDSAPSLRAKSGPGLSRRLQTGHQTGAANPNPLPVRLRHGQVSPDGPLSRQPRPRCRRNRKRLGLTHRRDRIVLRSCPPEHFAHRSPHRNPIKISAGPRSRDRPNPARPPRNHPRGCPHNDFDHSGHRGNSPSQPRRRSHHRLFRRRPRSRKCLGRNRNRPTFGPNQRQPGRQPHNAKDTCSLSV
jgi:hypothetical protein